MCGCTISAARAHRSRIKTGANVKVVQKPMGHKTAVLTLDRYGHPFPDDLDAIANDFDAAAESAAGGLRAVRVGELSQAHRQVGLIRVAGAGFEPA